METVLVTGSTGFLGRQLVRDLTAKGFIVRTHSRHAKYIAEWHNLPIEMVHGDLCNHKNVERMVKGCAYVIHAAAMTSQSTLNYEEYRLANVETTRALVKACSKLDLKNFVFVSSASTSNHRPSLEEKADQSKCNFPYSESLYVRSKIEAEELVRRSMKELHSCVAKPAFIIGPDDPGSSSGKLFIRTIGKRLVWIPPGGKSIVDVRDASSAICEMLQRANRGDEFILSAGRLSFELIYQIIREYSQLDYRILRIPPWLFNAAGILGDALRYSGIATELSSINTAILCTFPDYDGSASAKSLGFQYRPMSQSLHDATLWHTRGNDFTNYLSLEPI